LADTILRRTSFREFCQIEFVQLLLRKNATKEFAPDTASPFERSPQTRVGVVPVHESLREPLFGRQIVIRIHQWILILRASLATANGLRPSGIRWT